MKHFKFKFFFFFQFTDEESPSGSISPPPDGGSVNDWVFLPPNLQTTVHTSGMNVLLLLLFKNALYLSVNIFSTKDQLGTLFFTSLTEGGSLFYVVIRATRRSSRLQSKGSTFISQLF